MRSGVGVPGRAARDILRDVTRVAGWGIEEWE